MSTVPEWMRARSREYDHNKNIIVNDVHLRRCHICKEYKPLAAYSRSGASYQPKCKPCATAYKRAWRIKNGVTSE